MNKQEQEKSILHLYQEKNLSTYEIAEKFQTYPNRIRRVLKKNGVELANHKERYGIL